MTSEKSQLKFARSEETGELIGFVSRHSKTRKLMGVREDSRFGKQICVLSEDLKGTLEPNILYSVELKPMHKANGYVVVAATPVLFQAHVETVIVPKTLYQVTVTFGNKKIFFDPKDGKSVMSRTIDGVLEILKGRKDIKYKEGVITDYLNQHVLWYDVWNPTGSSIRETDIREEFNERKTGRGYCDRRCPFCKREVDTLPGCRPLFRKRTLFQSYR